MDLQAITQSLAGAVNNPVNFGANVNDTSGNAQEMANIRAMVGLLGQGDAAGQAIQAGGGAANQQAANEEANARAAAARAADEEEAKRRELERLQDPNQYQAKINDSGGYDFYDPMGNKIGVKQYAKAKNMHVTDVLKDSQSDDDKDFMADYNRVVELGKIIENGDAKARDKFSEENPEFTKAYGGWKYEDVVDDLHRNYPEYFRGQEARNSGIGDRKASDIQGEEEKKKGNGFFGGILKGLFG
jgi:hypothetical protein